MKSFRFFAFSVGVATLGAATFGTLAHAADYVRCESERDRRVYCDVRGARDADIELDRQLSNADCIEDYSWGTDRRGVWVDHGCRAEFRVSRGYGRDDRYDDERRDIDRERERLRLERERLELEREKALQQPVVKEQCPPGFHPSENKCTTEERRRGCKDMRLPGGLGCVKR